LKGVTIIALPTQPISLGFLFIIIYETPTKRTCNLYGISPYHFEFTFFFLQKKKEIFNIISSPTPNIPKDKERE